jgi:hypothetical protein
MRAHNQSPTALGDVPWRTKKSAIEKRKEWSPQEATEHIEGDAPPALEIGRRDLSGTEASEGIS